MKNFKASTIKFLREYSFDLIIGFVLATCLLFFMSISARAQNVGINNPMPHAKSLLDLTSTNKGLLAPRMTQAQRLVMFPAADITAKGMLVYQTDNTQGFYYYDGAAWQCLANGTSGWGLTGNAGTSPSANFLGTTDNTDMAIKTNNQEWIRLTAGKKLGIGTTTFAYPTARMEIADEDGFNSDLSMRVGGAGYPDLNFLKQRGTLAAPAATLAGDVSGALSGFAYDGTKYMLSSRITFYLDSAAALNDVAGSIRMYTCNNNLSPEAMTINSKGNVGIGNSLPGFPLNFASTLGDKISLYGNSGAHYGFGIQGSLLQIHSGTSVDDIAFGYGNSATFSERMRIKGNGKVGIGTSSPGNILTSVGLEIADSTGANKDVMIRTTNNINTWQALTFGRTRGTFSAPTVVQNNDNIGRLSGMGYDGALFQTAAEIQYHVDSVPGAGSMPGNMTFHTTPPNSNSNCIERMRIDHFGNVGIGTSAPAAKLDVNGSIKITNGTQGAGKILTSDAAGNGTWQTLNASGVSAWGLTGNAGTSAATNYMGTSDNNDVVFKSNNLESFRIRINQRIGMGTAFPSQKLDVNGHINISNDSTYRIGNIAVLATQGVWNTFIGHSAGVSNDVTWGQGNTFAGHFAGNKNTTGAFNTFCGGFSGMYNTTALSNTFYGYKSGGNDSTGGSNTIVGYEGGHNLATGSLNTYLGYQTGWYNVSGNYNTFIGSNAGTYCTVGYSTFIGTNAGKNTSTGTQNTFVGLNSGMTNTAGANNTFLGYYSGFNTSGSDNTFIGNNAGVTNTSGSGNTFLGNNADVLVNNLTNAAAIGANAKVGVSNAIALGAAGTMVGVGLASPGFPLNFAGTVGDKISLFGSSGPHYGFGVQSALLQIHSATAVDDIAFGYGTSAAFSEVMRVKGSGSVGIGTTAPLTSLEVNGGVTFTADASLTANAANFTIAVGNRSYIRINSNAAPASRLITLSNGLQVGQLLMIECSAPGGVNGIRMSDTPSTYNTNLTTFHDMFENDVITLLWNGVDWIETAYSNN